MIMLISFMLIKKSVFKAEQPLQGMELKKKEVQKELSIQQICLERTYS